MGTHPIFESDFDCLTEIIRVVPKSTVEMYPASSVAEDSGVATNNESANEKPSSRKRSAREIAQLYEQLKSKHIQRKREWNQEREMLLARCKATENSQQVLRNVRGILEQLRLELKREEARRNELEKEFANQRVIWGQEQKQLHEEIFELQRTERMWLESANSNDSRVLVLHKKVQELRNEKLVILKNAENERLNWEESRNQLLTQLSLMGGASLVSQNPSQTELNHRLDNALEQIENVSRQLCSVQDQKPQVGFINHLGQTRQISSSTSRLDDISGQRPKSSFDMHLLFGNRSPANPQKGAMDRTRDQTGLNGPIPYRNQSANQKGAMMARPDSGKNDTNAFANIQSTNLRNLQSLSLNGSYQLNHQQAVSHVTAEHGQSQMKTPLTPKLDQVKKPQPLDVNKGVRFAANPVPTEKVQPNGFGDFQRSFNEQRAFDSDDGAAKIRREQRMRRFKMLEARRNIPGGETTDDGGFEEEPLQRTRRSKKYTRSKTDTSAAEMKAFSKNNFSVRPSAPITSNNFQIDKPKVLRQFEKKLMENENKETSKESNGLIERNLTGSTAQNGTAPVQRPVVRRNSGNIPDRRGSNGAAERRASSYQPDRLQESVIVTKAEPRQTRATADVNGTAAETPKTQTRISSSSATSSAKQLHDNARKLSSLSRMSRLSGSTPNLSQAQKRDMENSNIQLGFDCTAAERAQQLRSAREKIEMDKIKRTESLKQRISIFESNRQKSMTIQSGSPSVSVNRTQSLKMAPTFLRTRATDDSDLTDTKTEERKSSISESLAERRSMVAGILSAGPPKKSGTSKKYKRAETLPIETTEKSEPTSSSVVDRPPGPANRRLPSRWRSGKPSTTDYDDFSTID